MYPYVFDHPVTKNPSTTKLCAHIASLGGDLPSLWLDDDTSIEDVVLACMDIIQYCEEIIYDVDDGSDDMERLAQVVMNRAKLGYTI